MQMNKLLKTLIFGAGLVALTACSTTHSNAGSDNGAGMNGSDNGTMVNGVGSADGFGSNGDARAMQVANQHYYFDFNKYDVRSADMASIKVQGNYLATHPSAKILLEGNTDPRGSREYNIALGAKRASAVKAVLLADGANANQISTVSYGAEKPVATGQDESSYQQDRRVDVVYQTPIKLNGN